MDEIERDRRALALFEAIAAIDKAEREGWIARETAGDVALEKRLRALITADEDISLRTGGAWNDARQDDDALPERIAAYRITDRIGQGGMGSVYRGQRDTGDFHHVVAIKVIKPGLLSDALNERFRRERQTLAQLSHPNIAQLFDGGELPDGSPYFIMEHVAGRSLRQWVEEVRPGTPERLAMFDTICRAVAFAHRSLIVHRDITPSNILVTDDGVVKLIDFGISKAPDSRDAAQTTSGVSLGGLSLTPGYAAPERMVSANVSTTADIYSLGRLLGWMFAQGDAELRAIIGRATSTDPNDRYPTVETLAADVSAWASGRPVSAMAGGKSYRVRKFVARNRYAIGAVALALALLVGALFYALIARADAEARFEQTRGIAKALLFDVFDEVSKTPGSTRARHQLAEIGVQYLDALSGNADAPRDVLLEAGRGYLRLAEVVGGGQAGSLSRYRDGNALLAKSEAILKPLYETAGDDAAVATAYAALLNEQSGTNLYNNGEIDLARAQARKAQAILEPLTLKGDARRNAMYITALHAEGDTYEWDDNYEKARPVHERAEAFAASLPPAEQASKAVMSARSVNLRLLGEAYHKLKMPDRARAVLDRNLAINRALVRAEPDDPALIRKLVNSLRYAAVVHRTNARDPEAREAITEAVAQARILAGRDPRDGGSLHLLAIVQEVQAQILTDLGRFSDSYRVGEDVLAAYRRLIQLTENADGARRSMAAAMRTMGGNHYNGGDYAGACALWRGAMSIYADLDKAGTLAGIDRNGGMAEMIDYIARSCDNGDPRPGLGTDPI